MFCAGSYDLLLRLYPAAFYRHFSDDMSGVIEFFAFCVIFYFGWAILLIEIICSLKKAVGLLFLGLTLLIPDRRGVEK